MIDEVDVFFSKDFYGVPFKPLLTFSNPEIREIIRSMWTKKNSFSHKLFIFESIINSTPEYEACVKKFPEWIMTIIKNHLKKIYLELVSFQNKSKSNYIVRDDMIGYVEQDDVNFNVSNGYETMFVYFYENALKKIR